MKFFFARLVPLGVAAAAAACGPTPLDVVDLPPRTMPPPPPPDAMVPADSPPSVPPPIRRGLVAHWSFDESAGALAHDDSGNGYHGHLVGGRWTTGRFGGGLDLSRGDFCEVNGFESATPAWTISVWAHFASNEIAGAWGAIVSTELPGQGGWMVYLEGNAPFILPRLNFEYAPPGKNLSAIGCCSLLASDVWYHVTLVADAAAGTLTFYEGSRAQGVAPLSSPLPPGDPTLHMGKWRPVDANFAVGGYLSGTIDDISIFSRALLPSEVAALDAAALPPP